MPSVMATARKAIRSAALPLVHDEYAIFSAEAAPTGACICYRFEHAAMKQLSDTRDLLAR